jgi:hypothetical protein
LTFTQRTVHVVFASKARDSARQKQYPLEIRTIGDLLMVRRKHAGLSRIRLMTKTGIRIPWLRAWEFDLCLPPQRQWDMLRKELNLPPTPVLIISQSAHNKRASKPLGEQLPEHRAASRLRINEAPREIGVSATSLGAWESNRAFPSVCWHSNRTSDCYFDARELKTAVGPFYAPRHSGGSRVKWQHQ